MPASKASTAEEYIAEQTPERQEALNKLRTIINSNLPKGFEERMSYGMIGWVVPLSRFPEGYHCDPKLPLPFLNLASQKNFIALYHMGVYAKKEVYDWFVAEYAKQVPTKLDMGKSCVRFKKMEHIPYELIAELMSKFTPESWIELYETSIKK